jgi:hypothetical protein
MGFVGHIAILGKIKQFYRNQKYKRMNMKQIKLFATALVFILGLAACGSKRNGYVMKPAKTGCNCPK